MTLSGAHKSHVYGLAPVLEALVAAIEEVKREDQALPTLKQAVAWWREQHDAERAIVPSWVIDAETLLRRGA